MRSIVSPYRQKPSGSRSESGAVFDAVQVVHDGDDQVTVLADAVATKSSASPTKPPD